MIRPLRSILTVFILLLALGRPGFAEAPIHPNAAKVHRHPKRARIFWLSGIGLTTVGLILGGVGVGAVSRSNGEANQINHSTGVFDQMLDDRSKSDRALGLGTLISGGILLVGGAALQVLGGIEF